MINKSNFVLLFICAKKIQIRLIILKESELKF